MGRLFPAIALSFVSGCDCTGPETPPTPDEGDGAADCPDLDSDGHRDSACGGWDCDDRDPSIWEEAECTARCSEDAHATGCPCEVSDFPEPEICYSAPAQTLGVGECRAGLRLCRDDEWSVCDGQVVPTDEVCDERDNTCDGEVDEGVQSKCGNCSGDCDLDCWGDGCQSWGDDVDGLQEDADGDLVIGDVGAAHQGVWIARTAIGDLFRIDAEAARVDAIYWTGPTHGEAGLGRDPAGADGPSRVTVDAAGDAIVTNRGIGIAGSVAKFGSEGACVDSNGDGRVETNEGPDDEVLRFGDDECLLWGVDVGDVGEEPLAIALTEVPGLDGVLEGRAWVGLRAGERLVALDTEFGEEIGLELATPACEASDAAIDADGLGVVACGAAGVAVFDAWDADDDPTMVQLPDEGAATAAVVDETGAFWIAGSDLYRGEHGLESFERVGLGAPQAVGALASDGAGSVWVGSAGAEERVRRVEVEGEAVEVVETPGTAALGVTVDFAGRLWAVGSDEWTHAAIVDGGDVEVALDDCAGADCLSWPSSGADATGRNLWNSVEPRGTWTTVVDACGYGGKAVMWGDVSIDATIPDGTSIDVEARAGNSVGDLAGAPWIAVGTAPRDGLDMDLGDAFEAAGWDHGDALLMQVRLTLRSEQPGVTPTLQRVEVSYDCGWGDMA